jgi:hypothetical protein
MGGVTEELTQRLLHQPQHSLLLPTWMPHVRVRVPRQLRERVRDRMRQGLKEERELRSNGQTGSGSGRAQLRTLMSAGDGRMRKCQGMPVLRLRLGPPPCTRQVLATYQPRAGFGQQYHLCLSVRGEVGWDKMAQQFASTPAAMLRG